MLLTDRPKDVRDDIYQLDNLMLLPVDSKLRRIKTDILGRIMVILGGVPDHHDVECCFSTCLSDTQLYIELLLAGTAPEAYLAIHTQRSLYQSSLIDDLKLQKSLFIHLVIWSTLR